MKYNKNKDLDQDYGPNKLGEQLLKIMITDEELTKDLDVELP